MKLIINNSSMQPIYEQICTQIKNKILSGELKQEEMLPSVRTFAKELRVSALTVKKAYDALEQEGFIVTVHGKGSFVSGVNQELCMEEKERSRDGSGAGNPQSQKLLHDRSRAPGTVRADSGGLGGEEDGRDFTGYEKMSGNNMQIFRWNVR